MRTGQLNGGFKALQAVVVTCSERQKVLTFAGRKVKRCFSSSDKSVRPTDIKLQSCSPSNIGQISHDDRIEYERLASPNELDMATVLSHAGLSTNHRALSPPLELASTFERSPNGEYPPGEFIYGRMGNPTRHALEEIVAKLETNTSKDGKSNDKLASCSAFSSGMAAISAIIMAHPKSVVILPDDCYHGVPSQLVTVLTMHGIIYKTVDMSDLSAVEKLLDESIAYQSSRQRLAERDYWKKDENSSNLSMRNLMEDYGIILWVETPSNPLTKVTDISALVRIAKRKDGINVTVAVDSTWSPPCFTQPLLMGADVCVHSATKYIGGHSDVVLGIATSSLQKEHGRRLGEAIRAIQINIGAVASPFDCWLTLRGLRTLDLRLKRAAENALQLAVYLESVPQVKIVHYPGLSSHPGHNIAKQQMNGYFGGMLSFELENEMMATAVAGAVKLIRRATSLGGTESLIEHRYSIEPEQRKVSPPGLLRMSVGIENIDDIKTDIRAAIDVATKAYEKSMIYERYHN